MGKFVVERERFFGTLDQRIFSSVSLLYCYQVFHHLIVLAAVLFHNSAVVFVTRPITWNKCLINIIPEESKITCSI